MPELQKRARSPGGGERRELARTLRRHWRATADAAIDDADIPRVEAFGRKAPSPIVGSDRGGCDSIPNQEPLLRHG